MTWATTNQQYDTVLSNCGKMSFEPSGWNWIFPMKKQQQQKNNNNSNMSGWLVLSHHPSTTRLCPNVFRKLKLVAKITGSDGKCSRVHPILKFTKLGIPHPNMVNLGEKTPIKRTQVSPNKS